MGNMVTNPEVQNGKMCKTNCEEQDYRILQEIPECISSLSRLEKYALRVIRIFCRGSRPQWTKYHRFFGRPDLSLVFDVWEDLSGLLSFDNDYNAFTIHSTENVIEALIWLRSNNYFYRNISDEIISGFLENYNVNQNIINENSNLEEINRLYTRPRNINQESYSTEDAQFGVVPVAEMIDSEGISVRRFEYREIESGLFPYLFPNGCHFNFPTDGKYAMRLKNLCFHEDSRFRSSWSWLFYHFDMTEYQRIAYNQRRLIREEYANANPNIAATAVLTESRYRDSTVYDDNITTTIPTTVRGAFPYLMKSRGKAFAVMRTVGIPTLFITFSCDEANWISTNMYLNYFGEIEANNSLPSHIQNPWLANHVCYERLQAMCKFILKKGFQGHRVKHYFKRFEFQNRGTVHMHMLLWLDDPNIDYILQGIRADIPNVSQEPLLYWLVRKYQHHQCSENYCLRNGSCRFYFPKPVSDESFYDAVNDNYVLKRNSNETRVNAYHKNYLEAWRSNMDIKIVTSENVAFYMSKYMTKEEPFEVIEETTNYARRYLETRNYSIHEISHYTMGNQITAFDVQVVAIPLCYNLINRRTLRPVYQIQSLDEEDEDIFYNNPIDKYCNRHISLEDLTIVEYFQKYKIASGASRQDTVIDMEGVRWNLCRNELIVRVYPYYIEWAGDRYYAQVILKLNAFRDANDLLQSCQPWREYVQAHHQQAITADTNFDEQHQEDIMRSDIYPDDLYTRLVNMYNLTLENFRANLAELNDNQYSVYNSILTSDRRFHIVSGGPGTGKTFLLRTMVYAFARQGKITRVTASTGVAAYLIGGRTIHSFLRVTKLNEEWVSPLTTNPQSIRDTEYLIIDEYSMTGQTLFELIMSILNKDSTKHIVIVLFGDPLQLPPVKDNPISMSRWYAHFVHHRLTTSQRSSDTILLSILHGFYDRTPTRMAELLNFINNRLTFSQLLDEPYVFAKRWECNNFNNNRIFTLGENIHTFQYFNVSNTPLPVCNYALAPESIKKQFRYLPELKICVNSKVMLLNNIDVTEGLVNGSFGTVREITMTEQLHEIKVEFASREGPILITLRPTREQIEEWCLYQFPICPAYATTVHKVQGST